MKVYEVVTEHTARFTYWVAAETDEAAGEAALALTDYEVYRADIGDIDYEMDVGEVMDAEDGHGHVFDAAAVLKARDADDGGDYENVGELWEEAYA